MAKWAPIGWLLPNVEVAGPGPHFLDGSHRGHSAELMVFMVAHSPIGKAQAAFSWILRELSQLAYN